MIITNEIEAYIECKYVDGRVPLYKTELSAIDTCEGWNIGCVLGHNAMMTFCEIFRQLQPSEREIFRHDPQKGEFVERFQFWRTVLKNYLPPNEYYATIHALYRIYKRIILLPKYTQN